MVSTESTGRFKPHPDVYRSAADTLHLAPEEILLVSSNGFDLAGARHFGLRTARIERMPPDWLRSALDNPAALDPSVMLSALS